MSLRRGKVMAALFLAAFPLAGAETAPPPPPTSEGQPSPPLTVADELTVTATRTERRLGDTAASVVVLSAEEIAASAAPTVDDALRQVPGFSLFRRSGSRFANPTSQGVSLRGLGASGASRAAVLADGIPLNDPFGGWVYWGRVPRASLDRVEVLRGAASDLYGSAALGGAVQLLRRTATAPRVLLDASYGEPGAPDGSLFASGRRGAWGASLAAEASETGGYILVDPRERGAVDVPANSRRSAVELTVEHAPDGGGRLFLRGSLYDEDRGNGTPLQDNDTEIRQWSAGWDRATERGSLSLRTWAGSQELRQGFSAVAADRDSERLTRSQKVPAESAGLATQWSRALGSRHALVAGLELRQVEGDSDERIFTAAGSQRVIAGGTQRTGGLFVEDVATLTPRLSLTLGGRIDGWRNLGEPFPEREETAFSPRVSLLLRATDSLSWTAAAYRAFRAPTLNELYRAFRVGDALTLANEDLEAERLGGGETGAIWLSPGGRVSARGVLYWMEIDRTIANVTLSVEPGLITRQRQNLGRTRSRGLEAELTARAGERWTVSGGYLLSDARVVSFSANPALEGLFLPQVPRHQLTLQARYAGPPLGTAGLQVRWSGPQYDDDQNRLRLGSATTVDALVSHPFGRGISGFVAVENLFDERPDIGLTPVRTLGPPRSARLGIRIETGPKP